MISIRKTETELDRLEKLLQAAATSYGLALRSTAQYAIELEPSQTAGFRRHLEALQEKSRAAATVEEVQAVQSSFRGELRDYRDQALQQIGRLRTEAKLATAALQTLAATINESGADHELQVKTHLTRLETAAGSDDIRRIRSGIRTAATGIIASFEEMRASNQFTIAQLQDEIRMLHQVMEAERVALYTDHSSSAWNHQKLELRIGQLVRQDQPFCVLLVCLRNLKWLQSQHPASVIDSISRALVVRFRALVGTEATVGRWSENAFAAILDVASADAVTISRDAARVLSGSYAVQQRGQALNVALQAAAGVVDLHAGSDLTNFSQKLMRLADALSGS